MSYDKGGYIKFKDLIKNKKYIIKEGHIVKNADPRLEKKVMQFLTPYIEKRREFERHTETEMEKERQGGGTARVKHMQEKDKLSMIKLQGYVRDFVWALGPLKKFKGKKIFANEYSHAGDGNTDPEFTTATSITSIMHEMRLETMPMKNIEKFERKLTEYLKK